MAPTGNCPICDDPLDNGEDLTHPFVDGGAQCGDAFHFDCLDQRTNAEGGLTKHCPVCNAQIDHFDIEPAT